MAVQVVMANGRSLTLRNRLAGLGLVAQSAVIAGALVLAWLLVAPLATRFSGTLGLKATLLAAVACYAGAQFSLLISALIRGSASIMNRLVLGMIARAMFPMVLGAGLHLRNHELAGAGLILYVLVFYLVTLAADTALLVAQVPQRLTSKSLTPKPLVPRKAH